jgi:hypothetical protein
VHRSLGRRLRRVFLHANRNETLTHQKVNMIAIEGDLV